MHQIRRQGPSAYLLRVLILAIAILDPVLPQLLAPSSSQAYARLIGNSKDHRWWMTCHENLHHVQQICLQYMAAPQEENSTLPEEAIAAQTEGTAQVEYGWGELAMVVAEQGWKVGVQAGREWMARLLRQVEVEEVSYDNNYASLNGGAILLRKSSKRIHKAEAILEDSSDKYLYSDEQLPIEVVIALKEEVKVEKISIRSSQVYSSIVRQFEVDGALNLEEVEGKPKSNWQRLLSATAKNKGAQQVFFSKKKVARFLRLRIISKYGDWKYFTMTQLKVYGEGLFTEALVNLQTVHSTGPPVRSGELELAQDLGEVHHELTNSGGDREEENVLSFLLEKVRTMSKVHEFELFYMQNLSMHLKNLSRLERDFMEHRNRLDASLEKSRQQLMESKLAELEAVFTKKFNNFGQIIDQFKFADLSSPQVCPNREEELTKIIIITAVGSVLATLCLSGLVGYCCFRYLKPRNLEISQQGL